MLRCDQCLPVGWARQGPPVKECFRRGLAPSHLTPAVPELVTRKDRNVPEGPKGFSLGREGGECQTSMMSAIPRVSGWPG